MLALMMLSGVGLMIAGVGILDQMVTRDGTVVGGEPPPVARCDGPSNVVPFRLGLSTRLPTMVPAAGLVLPLQRRAA